MIYKANLEITIDASKYNLHMSENARNLCFICLQCSRIKARSLCLVLIYQNGLFWRGE